MDSLKWYLNELFFDHIFSKSYFENFLSFYADPVQWSEIHVKHWIDWAIREFKLVGVNPENFRISGKQLCELTHPEFVKLIPNDKGDIFWTHLELLRKCKFVGRQKIFY